jgi:anti-sigma B factor antagonist
MHVHVERGRTYALVRPIGSFFGGSESMDLEHILGTVVEDGVQLIVVDLSRTKNLNSTAIGILVGIFRRAESRGCELRLCGADADLQNVLMILKLVNVIPVFATVDQAISAPPQIPRRGSPVPPPVAPTPADEAGARPAAA